MAYATVAQLRVWLSQITTGAANDAGLQEVLDRATAMIDLELGFSLADYGAAACRDVRADATADWLFPPPYQAGSIVYVYPVSAKGMSYESLDDAVTEYDVDEYERPYGIYRYDGWTKGTWYRIMAKWGPGAPPTAIEQLCLELARDLWQARDGNMSSLTVGAEGAGSVGVQYAWTHRQYTIIQQTRRQYGHFGVS